MLLFTAIGLVTDGTFKWFMFVPAGTKPILESGAGTECAVTRRRECQGGFDVFLDFCGGGAEEEEGD